MVAPEDLKHKVIFELVANSWLPVTPFSQQQDIQGAITSLGGVEALLVLDERKPAWLRQLLKPFNFSLEAEDADDVSTLCLQRLEQMREALQGGVDDPSMLIQFIQPPVSMYEPKHKEKQLWWSEYLDLPRGQESPLVLRQGMEQMFNLHLNYATQIQMPEAVNQGMIAGMGQAAAAAPMAMGAQAMGMGQEGQPQQDDQALELEAKASMQEGEQVHEKEIKAMEIQGQLANTELQGENQIRQTQIAGKNQIAAVKARPKPKPAARKTA